MERKPLGAQIKLARKQAGMTADKLAEVCNMDTTYSLPQSLSISRHSSGGLSAGSRV